MPQAPSFSKQVMPLIVEGCTGYCHPSGYAPMPLTANELYYNLVQAPSVGCEDRRLRVTPGKPDPKDSHLMAKLTGTAMCGDSQPMPPRGGRWPESALSVVREWIAAGAKND
jgi:hypothetical protein